MCLSGDSVLRMSSLSETVDAVKSAQQVALICSGLNRCSISGTGEVTLELMRPDDKYPRYTVFVADRPNIKNPTDMSFAAFIVPQGRLVCSFTNFVDLPFIVHIFIKFTRTKFFFSSALQELGLTPVPVTHVNV